MKGRLLGKNCSSYFKFAICKALAGSVSQHQGSMAWAWCCSGAHGTRLCWNERCHTSLQRAVCEGVLCTALRWYPHPPLNLQVKVLCMILRVKKYLCSHRANLSLVFPGFFHSLPLLTSCFLPHPPRKFIAPVFYSIESWHTHFHTSCSKMPPFSHGNALLLPLRGINDSIEQQSLSPIKQHYLCARVIQLLSYWDNLKAISKWRNPLGTYKHLFCYQRASAQEHPSVVPISPSTLIFYIQHALSAPP